MLRKKSASAIDPPVADIPAPRVPIQNDEITKLRKELGLVQDNRFCDLGRHWYIPNKPTSSVNTDRGRLCCGICSYKGKFTDEASILAYNFCKVLEFAPGHFIVGTENLMPPPPKDFIGNTPFAWITQERAAKLFDKHFDDRPKLGEKYSTIEKGKGKLRYEDDVRTLVPIDSGPLRRSSLRPILKAEREDQEIEALEASMTMKVTQQKRRNDKIRVDFERAKQAMEAI